MAVFLDVDYSGPHWNKFRLEPATDRDKARIAAGKAKLKADRTAFLVDKDKDVPSHAFGAQERPRNPEFLPHALRLVKGRKLPDYDHCFSGGSTGYANAPLVSEAMKDLIEAHRSTADGWQFFPIEIVGKDDTALTTYHAWCVHRVRDAIDEASTGVEPVSGGSSPLTHYLSYTGPRVQERLMLHKSVIEGLNAWIDNRFFPGSYFFVSDKLFAALQDAGFSGFAAQSKWSEA
ncbi:imm11 family protein [Roseovarius sp. S4756]|uniref:imm11 family protein n=1 Tax=Roseovarius maritimus TaxID=3342637 RepID=UPI00372B409A